MSLKRTILIGLFIILGLQSAFAVDYEIKLKTGAILPEVGVSDEFVNALLKAEKSERIYGLIQFYQIPDANLKTEALTYGVELFTYIPNMAYLASFEQDSWNFISSEKVRAVMKIPSDSKLSEQIRIWRFLKR